MTQMRKTKIVATMGPSTRNVETLKELIRSGINICRFNFSHDDQAAHLSMVELVRKTSKELNIPVALMLDTKGPEIRTGMVKNQGKIKFINDKKVIVTTEQVECDESIICISYMELPNEIKPNNHIFIADGLIDLIVEKVEPPRIHCRVVSGGEIGSKKNVNVPGIKTKLPAVTEKDESDIRFAAIHGFDYIAASFIRKPSDINTIYKILKEYDSPIQVIAKIEDEEGLENIDEIIRVAGGIMVARGDLGVQVETERIPLEQKRIIKKCRDAYKPVITATQMLESMVKNPRPTRAEVSDVANAIFDGTDAVMLSGETAQGDWPVEAVRTMHKVAMMVESSEEYKQKIAISTNEVQKNADVPKAVARAAYQTARDLDVTCIIAPSTNGLTARLISRWKPTQTIIAPTSDERVLRQLLLISGVYPILTDLAEDSDTMVQNSIRCALQANFIKRGDKVVIAAGLPLHSPLLTNALRVYYIGNVLLQGAQGTGDTCSGKIIKATTAEEAVSSIKNQNGEILVIPRLDESFLPLLRIVDGVIVEGVSELSPELIKLTNPSLVCISETVNAMKLENYITVTLNGNEKIVYEGILD